MVCVGDWQIQIIFTQESVLCTNFCVCITPFACTLCAQSKPEGLFVYLFIVYLFVYCNNFIVDMFRKNNLKMMKYISEADQVFFNQHFNKINISQFTVSSPGKSVSVSLAPDTELKIGTVKHAQHGCLQLIVLLVQNK